jgi:hypothetical protein
MRPATRVVLASLLGFGTGACANIWGFAELTSENIDGAADSQSGDAADGSDGSVSGDDASVDAAPDGSLGCNLANSVGCKGLCPASVAHCGCLADQATQTTYCGAAGSGTMGANCSSDFDCSPGFGCLMSTCEHWCRMGSTQCPTGTVCRATPTVTYNGQEAFYYCY